MAGAQPIRVLVVEPSAEWRTALAGALEGAELGRAEFVPSAQQAVARCEQSGFDAVLLDPEAQSALAAVEDLMAFRPTPILLLAHAAGGESTFRALALGALDVLVRPPLGELGEAFARDLRARLKLLSAVKVITHVKGRRAHRPTPAEAPAGDEKPVIVGIAASLGGPKALATLFRQLPRDLPAPMCVVQHITDGFTGGLASWLKAEGPLDVAEARDYQQMAAGKVYVAPSGAHLTLGSDLRLRLDRAGPVEGFRPSGTVLFQSMARRLGRRAVGVILTGMGRDGAAGLLELRRAGGRTLGQDAGTSTVYGMPRAAMEAGAVERQLPLEELGAALVGLLAEMCPGYKGRR